MDIHWGGVGWGEVGWGGLHGACYPRRLWQCGALPPGVNYTPPPIGGELYTSGAAPGVNYTPQTEGESNTLDDGLAREGR